MKDRPNRYSDVDTASFSLEGAIVASAFGECHRALRTEPLDIFLSVIAHSFSRVFKNRPTPTVFNESHGRQSWSTVVDPSRTVGWFTTIFPVHVPISRSDDVLNTVRQMKDSIRRIPDNGRPYFAHRYLTPEGQKEFKDHKSMEIIFNYLGRMQQLEHDDSLLQQASFADGEEAERLTADVGPNASRFALFEISAAVVKDKIEFSFIYNKKMKHQAKILQWVAECQQTFEEVVKKLVAMKPEPTLSDFPLLPMTYGGLDKMIKERLPSVGIQEVSDVEDIYPCASLQEGILISQLRDPGFYLFHATFEVKSGKSGLQVDGKKLAVAWQKVVNRHAALRTVFVDSVCKGAVFDQIVIKSVETKVVWIDCADSEVKEKMALSTLSETNSKRKLRLPQQLTICQTTSGKIFLKVEINHAVIDGGSTAIIVEDLIAAYKDELPEEQGPLYSNYIAYIKNQPPNADVKYWKSNLDGVQVCNFPVLNTAATGQRQLGNIPVVFDQYTKLQELCKGMKVTLANVMQATWALVLRSYTGSGDVCYGTLTSGRDVAVEDIQHAVGAFINILVCRIKFERKATLEGVFQGVQSNYLESLPHQHCSLAEVQHALGLSGKSLFNTAMSIQNNPSNEDEEQAVLVFEPVTAHDPSEVSRSLHLARSLLILNSMLSQLTSGQHQKMKALSFVIGMIYSLKDKPANWPAPSRRF